MNREAAGTASNGGRMSSAAFKLARATLRTAVKEYGWRRTWGKHRPEHIPLSARNRYSYGPGRFEGEHWSIVHYYEALMNGDHGDESGDSWNAYQVTTREREAFGINTDYVLLEFSSQGFVSLTGASADYIESITAEEEEE